MLSKSHFCTDQQWFAYIYHCGTDAEWSTDTLHSDIMLSCCLRSWSLLLEPACSTPIPTYTNKHTVCLNLICSGHNCVTCSEACPVCFIFELLSVVYYTFSVSFFFLLQSSVRCTCLNRCEGLSSVSHTVLWMLVSDGLKSCTETFMFLRGWTYQILKIPWIFLLGHHKPFICGLEFLTDTEWGISAANFCSHSGWNVRNTW